MPAPSSHGSFSVSLACSLREQIRYTKNAPKRGIGLQRGRESNLAAKALILLGFEDSNYPSPPNNEH